MQQCLRERVETGRAAARKRGRIGGRPRAISDEKMELIAAALAQGRSKAEVARVFAGPGGPAEGGVPTDPAALRAAVLEEVNDRRMSAGLDPLEPDPALDAVAAAALDAVTSEDALLGDPFGLQPEDASGWTSLGLRASSRGGAGSSLMAADAAAFVEGMAAGADGTLGGTDATHLGVAARTDGTGRKTAVAVFGGRG